jgi:uncharacterized membrane protein
MTGPGRTEAFSDGVFAIAITLLVLNLKVPDMNQGLISGLLEQWPAYATYALTFLSIGTIWVNHHWIFDRLRQVDKPLVYLNLIFLMAVSGLPFPTAILSKYLMAGHDEQIAVAIYGGNMAFLGAAFGTMWLHAFRSRYLVHTEIPLRNAWSILVRLMVGVPICLLAIGVAFFNARFSLLIYGVLAVYYAVLPIPGQSKSAIVDSIVVVER